MTYASVRAVVAALALTALTAVPAHAEPRDPWVRAWGANAAGQLGNGSTLVQQTPADVRGLARAGVRELAGGGWTDSSAFAVALMNDGTVQAWGGNSKGRLGDGTTTDRLFPAAVAGLSGASRVAAGYHFGYAVRGGRVLAWGDNAYGQLGDASTTNSVTPVVALPPGSGTTRVAASTVGRSSYAY